MNLIFQHDNVYCPVAIVRLIESRLLMLGKRQRVEESTVRLTDAPEASPRFQASILIRVPGPDIHATACDHTVRVAVEQALAAAKPRSTRAKTAESSGSAVSSSSPWWPARVVRGDSFEAQSSPYAIVPPPDQHTPRHSSHDCQPHRHPGHT